MASLARTRLARRIVSIFESTFSFYYTFSAANSNRKTIANSPTLFPQPLRTGIPQVRSIQTSADAESAQPFTIKLHEDSFRSHLCETPELDVEISKDTLLTMYKEMQTMRRMEMAADALYKAKLIRGFCHLAIGQVGSHYSIRVGEC